MLEVTLQSSFERLYPCKNSAAEEELLDVVEKVRIDSVLT